MMKRYGRLLALNAGASFAVLAACITPAAAAEVEADVAAQDQATTGPAEADTRSTGMTDIIVTAQRRAENLQDVPIAITALSAVEMENSGVSNLQDLGTVVPGLIVSNIQSNTTARLRGVGSSAAGPGIEPQVAIYVDGVYYASATGSLFSFNNVAQVSVLKGPQGTLFGRNAVGGLVQITTRRPTSEFVLEAEAGYGNFETATGALYVGGGLTDGVTADFALQGTFQGKGYGRNLVTGNDTLRLKHDIGGRMKIVAEPGPDTTLTFSGDYSETKGSLGTIRLEPGSTPNPRTGPAYRGRVQDISVDLEGFTNVFAGGGSLTAEHDFGSVKALSITAYRRLRYENQLDPDATATPYQGIRQTQRDRQTTQEFQLQSDTGPNARFDWTLGAYYFHSNARYDPLNVLFFAAHPAFPTNRVAIFSVQESESFAGYGQASYEILPRTRLTLGARYTTETRKLDGRQTVFRSGIPVANLANKQDIEFNKVTYRASLDHRVSDDLLLYASFNRGFKSGGFNAGGIFAAPFEPEVLDAYEVGFKSTILDGVATLDASAFHYDYTNIQIQRILGDGSIGIINGAQARIQGIDADFTAQLSQAFRLTLSAEILDTKFLDFPAAPISSPAGGTPVGTGSAKGNRLPLAPSFSSSVRLDYTHELSSGAKLTAGGAVAYNSGWFTEPDNFVRQNDFVRVNARLGWVSADERFNAAVWTENLTDAEVRTNATTVAFGNHVSSFAPPRTYGVTLGFKY